MDKKQPGSPVKPKIDKGSVKPKIDKANAPVEKPSKSLEQVDGGGMQQSQHPRKQQPRVIRYLRR